jgi:2-hydroxy-6-oxonona-2,4-dienedioate hydrolase
MQPLNDPIAREPAKCRMGRLAARTAGSGTPLVLLHGGSGSWTHWIRNIEALAGSHRVIAPDLPGFGDSGEVDAPGAPDEYIACVAQSIAEAGDAESRVSCAAFSFGGVLAAALAARFGMFDRLVLVAPGGFGFPSGRELVTRRVPSWDASDSKVREAIAFNLGSLMLCTPPSPGDAVVDLHLRNIERARFDSRRISLLPSLLADLAAVKCPVQIMWGTEDRLAHPSVRQRVKACRETSAGVRIDLVPDAGHWVQYEQAET